MERSQGSVPASGILVLECSGRQAISLCGTLLAQAGLRVRHLAPRRGTEAAGAGIPEFDGKETVVLDVADRAGIARAVSDAGVILCSSDEGPDWRIGRIPVPAGAIICDISAFGSCGPLAGRRGWGDALIQALSGIAFTTGHADGDPTLIGLPVTEYLGAINAATAVLAALRLPPLPEGRRVETALYDCGVNTLTTFLPSYFAGSKATRVGNSHPMAVPWNAYPASDGWVMVCGVTDDHWARITAVLGHPELVQDPRFVNLGARIANRAAADSIMSQWTERRSVAENLAAFAAVDIPCGPITTVEALGQDSNLRYRGTVQPVAQGGLRPGDLLAASLHKGATFEDGAPPQAPYRPLSGVRVLEIGQYTTAPLAGRRLASLGAEVIKIEPPEGDASRKWPPHRNGISCFFEMSNEGKTTLALDLRTPEGQAEFVRLVKTADLLVQNIKPGSLDRLGFDLARLQAINPRLIPCSMSGFGTRSVYANRPAFDTVVQGMCGLMDVTSVRQMPMKAGISLADIASGEFGVFAILAALRHRDLEGRSMVLDISMQDVGAWLTQGNWNGQCWRGGQILRCADGHVAVSDDLPTCLAQEIGGLARVEALARLERDGLVVAPVLDVGEVAEAEQTVARGLIVERTAPSLWPLFGQSFRISGLDSPPPRRVSAA